MSQNTEEKIDEFLAIADTSRAHALLHLQHRKFVLALAINDHFDGNYCGEPTQTLEQTRRGRDETENNNDDDQQEQQQRTNPIANNTSNNNNNNNHMMMMGNGSSNASANAPPIPANDANSAASTTFDSASRGRGRGRGARSNTDAAASSGRGRGRGTAAKTESKNQKQQQEPSSASNSDSSSSSDNSSDDDTDQQNGNANNHQPLRRAIGEETQVIRDFKKLAAIPCRTAAEDRALFERQVRDSSLYSLARASFKRELLGAWKSHHRSFRDLSYGAREYFQVGDPIHFLDAPEASSSSLTMLHYVPTITKCDCPCFFSASNYSPASTKTSLIKSSLKNGPLELVGPLHHSDMPNCTKAYTGQIDAARVHIGWRRTSASFNEDFGLIHHPELKDAREKYKFARQLYSNFALSSIVYPPEPVSNPEFMKRSFEGTSCAAMAGRDLPRTERDHVIIVEADKEFLGEHDDRNKTHTFHHLYLRLRSLESNSETDKQVRTNLRALGSTRANVWKRRFLIEHLTRCFTFERNQELKNEMPVFSNLYRELLTPQALFDMTKNIQAKSARDIFEFYGQELVRINTDVRPVPVRPPGVTVDLFPHQRRTVAFMLDREKKGVQQFVHSDAIPLPRSAIIQENGIQVPQGQYTHYRYHVNSVFGAFVATPVGSPADQECMTNGKHRGGVLADEVGMGKTLSILSLILLNPASCATSVIHNCDTPIHVSIPQERPLSEPEKIFKDNFATKLKIRATLVLAPVSLVGQWEEEIRKRAPTLKILRFHGADKKKRFTYADFAAADIVITTFETYRLTLRYEAFWFKWFPAYSDDLGGHVLRNQQTIFQTEPSMRGVNGTPYFKAMTSQFKPLGKNTVKDGQRPTPDTVFLSRLHFHRIVADEFHKPGGISADTTLIDSDNLWLVSGTPLDAPIGRFMKRLGVMDYSFIDADHVRFVSDTSEEGFIWHNDRKTLFDSFRSLKSYRPFMEVRPVWNPEQERMRAYTAPPKVACNVARLAFLSQYMIRNTVDTCPELASVRVTEKIININHSKKEAEKYKETLENVRAELNGMNARGTLQTRILYVLTLLNNLRRAAVDPFGVTINVRDALAVGGGAQFGNENERRNIHLVPVNIFAHLVFPNDFPLNVGLNSDGAAVSATDRAFTHVKSVTQSGTLKEELEGMLKDPPELEACMICLENLAQPTAVSCGHIFCRDCILQWIQRGMTSNCPACRKDSLSDNKKKSLLTFPPPPQEDKDQQVKAEKSSNEDGAEGGDEDPVAARIPTKIKKVMAIIREAIAEDETSKFLVFTAFPSVLRFLQEELARAAIGSVIIDGSSSLNQRADRVKQFQEVTNVSTRVCIVSSRVGNMGLTLTAANHLIIVEPASNIDVDTQILGRVKRLGQKRAVTCHRLLVEDSIEVPLYELVQARTVSLSASGSEAAKKAVTDTIMKLVYPTGVPEPDRQQQQIYHHQHHHHHVQNNNNNNNDNDRDENGLNAFERQQMAQIAQWEQEHGVV